MSLFRYIIFCVSPSNDRYATSSPYEYTKSVFLKLLRISEFLSTSKLFRHRAYLTAYIWRYLNDKLNSNFIFLSHRSEVFKTFSMTYINCCKVRVSLIERIFAVSEKQLFSTSNPQHTMKFHSISLSDLNTCQIRIQTTKWFSQLLCAVEVRWFHANENVTRMKCILSASENDANCVGVCHKIQKFLIVTRREFFSKNSSNFFNFNILFSTRKKSPQIWHKTRELTAGGWKKQKRVSECERKETSTQTPSSWV